MSNKNIKRLREIIREEIATVLKEFETAEPATKPKPKTKPGTKPSRRRTLKPPKEAPKTKPKASSERQAMAKVIQRYQNLKK